MSDFKRKDKERVSRQKAAERLADLAYALTVGESLQLTVNGERIVVPLADEVRLERYVKAEGDRVELALELSWSRAPALRPVAARAAAEALSADDPAL